MKSANYGGTAHEPKSQIKWVVHKIKPGLREQIRTTESETMTDTITLPRETVQQVLDALNQSQDFVQVATEGKLRHGWGNQLDAADKAMDLLNIALAQPAQEPVAWQYRTRPLRNNKIRFSDWVYCTKEIFDDCKKRPVLHDWKYETRALYMHPKEAK